MQQSTGVSSRLSSCAALLVSRLVSQARDSWPSSYFQIPSPHSLAISNGRRWGFDGPVQRTGARAGSVQCSASQGNTQCRQCTRVHGAAVCGWADQRFRAQLSGRMVCYGSCQREHQPLTPVNPHPARRVPAAAGRALGRDRWRWR